LHLINTTPNGAVILQYLLSLGAKPIVKDGWGHVSIFTTCPQWLSTVHTRRYAHNHFEKWAPAQ
jgi:hypothetical protein